ncbi:MAG: NADPH:quinone reductase [Acidobacteriota bacterium]|nr:NADPH:quinone reductase [Acidobacteriota bacterium]
MKAIRVHQFGGPEVLKLEEVPDPKPGAGEVLVRVHAAGVNPVDTYIRAGAYARKPVPPYVPGADAAGIVEAVGAGVTTVTPGARVYVIGAADEWKGTYAGLVVCRPEQVFPLPDRISFAQGTALGVPCATAYRALFQRGHGLPAEIVLVHGASGGVGTAAVQLARARGLTVIGTAGSDRGLQLVREQGAHHVFNHRSPGYTDQIMAATGGRGVDLVIEMAAHINLDNDLALLAQHGRVVVVGNRGRIEIDPRRTMGKEAAIIGMTLFAATPADLKSLHAALGESLANGTLTPVVGREFPLADAARAHEAVMEAGAYGKIVLVP